MTVPYGGLSYHALVHSSFDDKTEKSSPINWDPGRAQGFFSHFEAAFDCACENFQPADGMFTQSLIACGNVGSPAVNAERGERRAALGRRCACLMLRRHRGVGRPLQRGTEPAVKRVFIGAEAKRSSACKAATRESDGSALLPTKSAGPPHTV